MIGKIFVTSSGYDPQKGKHIKDPYLGPNPSMGACRPDIRERLDKGDHIFLISGKIPDLAQVLVGGFEIKEKIHAQEAFFRFPKRRLKLLPDGQVTGNIIVSATGEQHALDHHDQFKRRIENYIVGKNPLALLSPEEVEEGRAQTLEILKEVFKKNGSSIREVVGRHRNLTEPQILRLRGFLEKVKKSAT